MNMLYFLLFLIVLLFAAKQLQLKEGAATSPGTLLQLATSSPYYYFYHAPFNYYHWLWGYPRGMYPYNRYSYGYQYVPRGYHPYRYNWYN